MSKFITISAKCSDFLYLGLYDSDNNEQLGKIYNGQLGKIIYDGYVPDWLPNKNVQHKGDYVNLHVDIDTGKILNWVKPTVTDLKKTFDYPVIKNKSKPTVRPSTQYTKNIIPKGGVKVRNTVYNNVSDLAKVPKKNSNFSYLKLKRDASGKFIKMDNIAEFDYPHNGGTQFRVVKIVKETDKYIEGIQCNGENTGYKRFNVTRASGLYRYKSYLIDEV